MSFLDVNIIREQGKFTTSVYRKPTVSRIYTHFDSFSTSTGTIYIPIEMFPNLLDWTKFHLELVKLMDVFKSSG